MGNSSQSVKLPYARTIPYNVHMRYLGVDYGSKRVGLALSDEQGTMGFPHSIVVNTPRLLDLIGALIARENISAVVIGESRTLAGGANPIMKDAKAFGDAVAERSGVPVFYESEVFTSEEARHRPAGREELQAKIRKSRAPKARIDIDDSAAALILTSYLARSAH